MNFWFKYLAIILVLIGLAIALLNIEPPSSKETTEKAQKGLSAVYQGLKDQYNSLVNNSRYVIDLKTAKDVDLTSQLNFLEKKAKPISGHWHGSYGSHRFVPGDTLRSRLEDITEAESMNLIWWLERDFVVKHAFRVENNTLGTLYEMTKAIDSDFEQQVSGYLCPLQRALVITDEPTEYLNTRCVSAKA